MIGLFGVAFLLDLITTLLNYPLLEYLEANPLFSYGGLIIPVVVNVVLMFIFAYVYKKGANNARYYVMLAISCMIVVRIAVIFNNFMIYRNPPSVEQLQAIGDEALQQMKTDTIKTIFSSIILPYLSASLAWVMFNIDHEIIRK